MKQIAEIPLSPARLPAAQRQAQAVLLGEVALKLHHIDIRFRGLNAEEVQAGRAVIDNRNYQPLVTALERAAEPASVTDQRKHAAMLLAAYPFAAEKVDLEAFARLLADDIASLAPSNDVMDEAFRALRQAHKWLPSIAEVVAAIRDAQTRQRRALGHVRRLPELVANCERAIAEQQRYDRLARDAEEAAALRRREKHGTHIEVGH